MANSNNPTSRPDQITVSVIGLGYVGMPLAIALAKRVDVVAFDVSERAISRLMHRAERTQSVIASINPQILGNKRDSTWRDGTLSELIEIKYGKDHKKLAESPYPVYGSGGYMRN